MSFWNEVDSLIEKGKTSKQIKVTANNLIEIRNNMEDFQRTLSTADKNLQGEVEKVKILEINLQDEVEKVKREFLIKALEHLKKGNSLRIPKSSLISPQDHVQLFDRKY